MTLFLDLDGPILDVSERYYRVYRDVLSSLGLREPRRDRRSYWRLRRAGRPTSSLLAGVKGAAGREADFRPEWLARIESKRYLRYDRLIPGARAELSRLQEQNTMILVTLRRNRKGLDSQLERLKLRGFFEEVLSCAAPAQEGWKVKRDLIRSSTRLDRSSWVVGDSEVDILAGRDLGLTTVGVLSGICNRRRLQQFTPNFVIKDIGDLGKIIMDQDRERKTR